MTEAMATSVVMPITNPPTKACRCYTIADLMDILGVGRKSVITLLKKKEFPWVNLSGGQYRIPREPFEAWLVGKL